MHDHEAYHTFYRPTELTQVVGQGATVKALKQLIQDKGSQAFLFHGPSGCGKTTLARITADKLGVEKINLLEIDAATYTGVDDMRRIQSTLEYKAFGENGLRGILIDECQRISRQAWDSLLKSVEEPPPHITWFFCTTEPSRVPITIRTRCTVLEIKPVNEKDMRRLLDDICAYAKIKLKPGVIDAIVKNAKGSPRQALVSLALVKGCDNGAEATKALRLVLESDPVKALAKLLLNGSGSWEMAMGYVEKLEEVNPESIRIEICNYIGGALRNAKSDDEAANIIQVLDPFAFPYNESHGMTSLLISIGRVLFRGE
jgi:DNA polymerase-3 subunit gamma/tau